MPDNSTPPSCLTQDPFIKLGDSDNGNNVPTLDYNLPQTSSFVANGYLPLEIADAKFKTAVKSAPPDNYFSKIETAIASSNQTAVIAKVTASVANHYAAMTAFKPAGTGSEVAVTGAIPQINVAKAATVLLAGELTATPVFETKVAGVDAEKVAAMCVHAMPVITKNLAGKEVLNFIKKPDTIRPQLTIVEHYRVNTYLGNYGAGETTKTFSLLPGEKTTIAVKSWKTTTENRKQTENVLDSFNSESAHDLENIAEQESNDVSKEEKKKDSSVSGGLQVPAMGSIPVGANLSASKNSSSQSVREQTIKTLNRAISKQSQKSVSQRKMEVNTENSANLTEGEETTITRVLENLNKSRTLNFVFRQLNQELVTVTYLDDVTIVFSNGYPEAKKACKIDGLYELLTEVITSSTDVDDTYKYIVNHLGNVMDYNGVRRNFLSKYVEDFKDLYSATVGTDISMASTLWSRDFFHKNPDLSQSQTFELKEGDSGSAIGINGVIVNVTRRVMPTDSLVVDSLLGQGEALDCFSQKAQDSETQRLYLENNKTETGLDIISDISDAVAKSEAWANMWNPRKLSES